MKQPMTPKRQTAPDATAPLIRVIGADRATLDLLTEWLTSSGFSVATEGEADSPAREAAALVIIDIPFTRHGGHEAVQRVAAQYPGTRILALSSTFFSSVSCVGECARALGVDGVLPKPIARDTLITAVKDVLHKRE